MANPKDGFLDDIGEDTADTPDADAAAAPDKGTEAPEITTQADAQPEGEAGKAEKPVKTDPAHRPERPDGYVPLQALQSERARADQMEKRLSQIIDRYFSEKAPQEQGQKPEAEDDGPPDETQDPLGALAWTKKQLLQLQQERRQGEQQTQQQSEAQRQWQEAYGAVQTYFSQKVNEKPDLRGLYDGLRESYAKEYATLRPDLNPMQVAQLVEQQEASIIQWAYQKRYPIDEVIERLAASRGVAAKAAPGQDGQQQQGQQPPRDPATGQFVASDAEKAARARESQERNASLSSAPGAPVKKMTPKELASMPEEEMWRMFDNVIRKPGAKQFDRDMGYRS